MKLKEIISKVGFQQEEFNTMLVNVNGIESSDKLNSTINSFIIKNSDTTFISI